MLADVRRKFAEGNLAEQQEEARRRAAATENMKAANRQLLEREYIAAGLEPPPGKNVTSLAMLLQNGWRIEEIDGRPTLIAPHPQLAEQRGDDFHL